MPERSVLMWKILMILFFFHFSFAENSTQKTSNAKNKVDLDDVHIQGELHTDGSLGMRTRERNSLNDRVPLRKSFRDISLEDLPTYFLIPKQ